MGTTRCHILDFDQQSDFRNQEELVATDRIMRAEGHYSSPVFRIPKGDPDHNGLAQLQSQSLGYLQVDMDLDTDDWRHPPGQNVPVPPLDGRGHVILLHDGGGDRSATVAMLEKLIRQARNQGYTFTTLEPMLPQHYLPQKNIQPEVADRVTAFVAYALWVAPGKLLGGLFWFGSGSLVIMSGLYLLLALLTQWRQRRRRWPDLADHDLPYVSVVLAAYNEANVIARTLAVLRDSDYPASRYEVVAVNDGSTDNTAEILDICALEWSRLTVVHQENSGKSSALNNGINHTTARSTVIVTMDADTLFRQSTIRNLARHFVGHHNVGAVAGHVKVGNRRNIITAWQSLEYISGICVTRMAEMSMGAISIVPGACSAWRRVAVERIGGFCDDTLAEDADATLSLQKLGYAVVNENEAICDTEGSRDGSRTRQAAETLDVRQHPGTMETPGHAAAAEVRDAGHGDAAIRGRLSHLPYRVPAAHRRGGRPEPGRRQLAQHRAVRRVRSGGTRDHCDDGRCDCAGESVASGGSADLPAHLRAAAVLPALRVDLAGHQGHRRGLGQVGASQHRRRSGCCGKE